MWRFKLQHSLDIYRTENKMSFIYFALLPRRKMTFGCMVEEQRRQMEDAEEDVFLGGLNMHHMAMKGAKVETD